MAGNVQNVLGFLRVTEKLKPAAKVIGPAGMPVTSSAELERGNNGNREIVLGRNLKSSSFRISEPDDKDALDGKPDMVGIIDKYKEYLAERTKHQLGFPCNLEFEYGALSQLLPFSINNLGDPFIDSNYGIHSKQFELGVLDWFARLWELEENEYWGYITGGGTEGNLHGILIGRETFPDGILYASRDSHYSVFKASKIYRMDCVKVKTLVSGEIDCSDFRACLLQNIQRPAIVNVNIGTTVKGAIDDLNLVIKVLEQSGFNNRFYIHCDGALLGLMLPFMKHAPKLTFKKAIGSVSISGHKFVGTPFPCGVQITRMSHMSALSGEVELISSKDNTVMGSRNGHAPLYLWYGLKRSGYQGLRNEVDKCLHNARFLESRLREAGIGAMRNELSNIVVFERPQDVDFIRKWQLLCEGNIAHVVVMPNVTLEKLSVFAEDLVESRRVWLRDGEISPPCIEAEVGHENCACLLHLHE